ncbi:aminotransferase class I/II-fold pyridoxal phosphate-dependent enzyme [Streptomyces sp. TRM 70351]|uniref:DegT/DnrJ/EryC1/StrS family aminotransferase n=1 Tax=Streptomyces sp. TRM 70351 TaxID=3116552 RepID=UPI002E7C3757|nr:aminotransferase class I/II-fold pyridoxal phosphate-dependent enzyme [Streptomyces sp. TRM 70351]MEE1931521.1 aminotransferase class I/II-fold pyridoxal phosphate-dependent enzyme [Streptomyces sp. TRM 70351]
MTGLPPLPAADLGGGMAAALAAMPDPACAEFTGRFEHDLTRVLDRRHAVAVSSGTTALHTALSAIGVGPGDEVLLPALTVVMTAQPVVQLGATPVFVDSDPNTLDLDYTDAASKVTTRTKAIVPVHLWGRMGDPARLRAFAAQRELTIVEDAAQAAGTSRAGVPAGAAGAAGRFSTKDGKILWSGEGGFVLLDDPALTAHARALRGHWLTPPPGRRPQERLGLPGRMPELIAALAQANLRRFPALLERRRAQTAYLLRALAGARGLTPLQPAPDETWNHYSPLLRIGLPRPRAFAEHLAQLAVPSSTGSFRLVPCDTRPMFTGGERAPCRGAAQILDRTLALVLTERDDEAVLDRYAAVIIREAAAWHA